MGYMADAYTVKIISISEDKVSFIDYKGKEHTVKLYRDANKFAKFKHKNSDYYIRIHVIENNFYEIAYIRNGKKLIVATGADHEVPFTVNDMKARGFI